VYRECETFPVYNIMDGIVNVPPNNTEFFSSATNFGEDAIFPKPLASEHPMELPCHPPANGKVNLFGVLGRYAGKLYPQFAFEISCRLVHEMTSHWLHVDAGPPPKSEDNNCSKHKEKKDSCKHGRASVRHGQFHTQPP